VSVDDRASSDQTPDRPSQAAHDWVKYLPSRATLKQDGLAGLAGAISSVPDGMAASVLAGVSPIHGLYASMVGPIAGGLFASTQLLVVTSTSAAAIAASDAIGSGSGDARAQSLFLLTILVGVVQIGAGLLRLGSLTRFVSHSVMVGFLTGIAVNIILGQLPTITGYDAAGPGKVIQTLDLLLNVHHVDARTLAVGILALVLAIVLPRTRLGTLGALVALIIPSALVLLLNWEAVETVADSGEIPSGLPLPALPSLSLLSLDLIGAGIAIAVIVLVQGAGVSQGVPNPDGTATRPSRDFSAQGIANVAAGLFQGQPVGGSVGQTALSVQAGARTRWAAIYAGIWMAIILVVLAGPVGYIAMPALAALLILAGYGTIKVDELRSIWRTGAVSQITILTTFVATLVLPIQAAVGLGAALSAILHLSRLSTDVTLVELAPLPDGRVAERPPPERLPSHAVTVLAVYGSLFYAGAWTAARALPSPRGATEPVVILRLRGHRKLGATIIDVLEDYASQLGAAGGRLYLSGADEDVRELLQRTRKLAMSETVKIDLATDVVGESTRRAYADATAWLLEPHPERRTRVDDQPDVA
jgi:SulP family sulfate permease